MAALEEEQETARENGKKSHGPVTEEGKASSARNATTEPKKSIEPTLHTSNHGDNSTFPAEYSWFSKFTPPRAASHTT